MKVGLAGFPGSGKSTVFSALTGLAADPSERRTRIGTIKVPDPRVDFLGSVYSPKKQTYAEMSFVDFPPSHDTTKRQVLDADAVSALRDADALVEVVRAFPGGGGGASTPVADVDAFETELLLADLAQVERRLERFRKEGRKDREVALFERLHEWLEGERPLRMMGLAPGEQSELAGHAFLSLRPLLIVLNVAEQVVAEPETDDLAARATAAGAGCLVMSAQVETEVAELEVEDRAAFLADLGLAEPARDRFIRDSYALLDLISFLTSGEDECRAWPIRRGTVARKAAGKIHSDIERGFIRAEVVAFDDLVQAGSTSAARDGGTLRLEGKDYVVQDGDIIHFRFAV